MFSVLLSVLCLFRIGVKKIMLDDLILEWEIPIFHFVTPSLVPNLYEEVPEVKFPPSYFLVDGLPVVMTFNYSPVVFKQLYFTSFRSKTGPRLQAFKL